jgi:hypothetical protein
MSDISVSEIRRQAWQTRRKVYGPKGHASSYARFCPTCAQVRALVVRLHNEEILSEGQASKMLGIGRIELRKLADDQNNGVSKP